MDRMTEGNEIDAFEQGVLLELIRKTTCNAVPGSRFEKEVETMANAKIYELDTVKVYNESHEITQSANIRRMLALGKDPEDISLSLDVSLDRIKEERCKMDKAVDA